LFVNSDRFAQAEFMYKAKPKAGAQFDQIDRDRIPFAVIVAPDELKEGKVRIKEQVGKDAEGVLEDKKGVPVEREQVVPWLKEALARRRR
jgi:histidyl-tRNA synthetase